MLAPAVPLGDLLDRIGQELALVAELLDRFEAEVVPHIREAAGRDAGLVQRLQCLDQIVQRVTSLIAFLAALAPIVSIGCRLDPGPAAGVVTLAEMAARLGFRDGAEKDAPVDRGECEFL